MAETKVRLGEKCMCWIFFSSLYSPISIFHLVTLSVWWGLSIGCAELAYGNGAEESQRTQAVRSGLSLKQTAERCIITSANAEPVESPPPHTSITAASCLLKCYHTGTFYIICTSGV